MTFDQTYHSHTADGEAACGFRQSHFAALGAFAVAVDREFHGRGGRRPTRCCVHVFPFDVSFFMNMALLGFAFVPAAAAVHIEGQVQAGGGPLARSAVTLWAASAGEPKQLAQTRTRADGRFELHAKETPGKVSDCQWRRTNGQQGQRRQSRHCPAGRTGACSNARLSMCTWRHAGRLCHSWARRRHGAMPTMLLGAGGSPSGDLTTKNNQSRYHKNNY